MNIGMKNLIIGTLLTGIMNGTSLILQIENELHGHKNLDLLNILIIILSLWEFTLQK